MAIDDRRGAATMPHRRNFLMGIAGLIAAPAVVKADILMPILVWKPTFGVSHAAGLTMLTCRARDLEGVDLATLGLTPPHPWSGVSALWPHSQHPLWSLPRNRIRIVGRFSPLAHGASQFFPSSG